MKLIPVIKKSEALRIARQKGTMPFKYSSGKYEWLGSQANHIEKHKGGFESHIESINYIYFERKQDAEGAYCQIMGIEYA